MESQRVPFLSSNASLLSRQEPPLNCRPHIRICEGIYKAYTTGICRGVKTYRTPTVVQFVFKLKQYSPHVFRTLFTNFGKSAVGTKSTVYRRVIKRIHIDPQSYLPYRSLKFLLSTIYASVLLHVESLIYFCLVVLLQIQRLFVSKIDFIYIGCACLAYIHDFKNSKHSVRVDTTRPLVRPIKHKNIS